MEQRKITSFTQLRTWQKARDLAVMSYELSKQFPKEEVYGLTSQVRRSSVSVSANIAEGFSRASAKDKSHYYTIALGSLTESLSHAHIAAQLGFVSQDQLERYEQLTTDINKMIHGMMKLAKGKNT